MRKILKDEFEVYHVKLIEGWLRYMQDQGWGKGATSKKINCFGVTGLGGGQGGRNG